MGKKVNRKSLPGLFVKIERVGRDDSKIPYPEISLRYRDAATTTRVFSLADLNSDPGPLIAMASEAGISLLTRAQKEAFLQSMADALDWSALSTRADFQVARAVGWHGSDFVTPHRTFGASTVVPVIKDLDRPHRYQSSCTLAEWREMASRTGSGNPMLIFAACMAFAAPCLELVGLEGAGILVVGDTSTGKTSLSTFAGAVWGGDPDHKLGFADSWNATINALAPMAARTNDLFLVLDDTKNLEGTTKTQAQNFARAVFLLVSGTDKKRHTDSAAPAEWRLVYWASSNHTLRKLLAMGGIPYDPSYSVRLLEVPVEKPHGPFKTVPDTMTTAEFADHVVKEANRLYGAAGETFLEYLARWRKSDDSGLRSYLNDRMAFLRARLNVDGADGAQARVAEVFCLGYAAARLALKAGILPWPQKEITKAFVSSYAAHRRHVLREEGKATPVSFLRELIRQKRDQFPDVREHAAVSDAKPLGFVTSKREEIEFSFRPKRFRDAVSCAFDPNDVLAALSQDGLLIHDKGKKPSSAKRQTKRSLVEDIGRERVYCISGRILTPT